VLSDQFSSVLFLGHNPGAEELVLRLTGEYHSMPTAAIAYFEYDAESWKDCSGGRLVDLWRPKEID